jgi:hypothetical protein
MTPETPLISVVMAVYNGEPFLAAAIDSILSQTCRDFELIIVDDGSTDGTARILASYDDPRLVLLRNPTNLRQTRSLNRGLALARGRFVARHDADDRSHPSRFQRQIEALLADQELALLGTAYEVIDDTGHVLEVVKPPCDDQKLKQALEKGNIFCHGSVMMRRATVQRVGGYNEAFPVTQDYDLWLRISDRHKIGNLEVPLYQFRFYSQTVSRNSRPLQLAYRQLALMLAQQRLRGEAEGPIPEDMLQAFEPEPERLFRDARGLVYLYFVSGQMKNAEAAYAKTQRLASKVQEKPEWCDWTLGRALELAKHTGNPSRGAAFINWLYTVTPAADWQRERKRVLGRYYVDHAFQAHRQRDRIRLLVSSARTVSYDWRWMTDRGFLSIILRSLIPGR